MPEESTFSRAFAEFRRTLDERTHAALVMEALGEYLIEHISRDGTVIVEFRGRHPLYPLVSSYTQITSNSICWLFTSPELARHRREDILVCRNFLHSHLEIFPARGCHLRHK